MDISLSENNLTQAQSSMMKALESLLCEKPLSAIDVKQLCAQAHVARSTFYAYYRNIDELMEQLEDVHVLKITSLNAWVAAPDAIDPTSSPYEPTLDYLASNSAFFYAELITHHNGRFSEKWKKAIKDHLCKRLDDEVGLATRTDFMMEVAASTVVSACIFWLKNPLAVSREDVHVVIARSLELFPAFAD